MMVGSSSNAEEQAVHVPGRAVKKRMLDAQERQLRMDVQRLQAKANARA